MVDNIEVNQKAGLGSEVTQIGTQIVYAGLSPAEACRITTGLFEENFPKLQAQAAEVALARVNELMSGVAAELEQRKMSDMSAFSEPDVQYAIYEAQKSYARFGAKEKLSFLSSLIANRVQHDNNNICLKVAIDKAIEIAALLTTKHLDYLALLFLISQVKFNGIHTLEQLKQQLNMLNSTFPSIDTAGFAYLNQIGCLRLNLVYVTDILSKTYGLPKEQVESICPQNILKLDGDYTTSHVGTILAITYVESITKMQFNPEIWIK